MKKRIIALIVILFLLGTLILGACGSAPATPTYSVFLIRTEHHGRRLCGARRAGGER